MGDRLDSVPSLLVPLGCVTAGSLHSLGRALDRLAAFHRERGGTDADVPCVKGFYLDGTKVFARVLSGTRNFKLELVGCEWVFC